MSCTACDSLAPWNSTDMTCYPNCSPVTGCSSCSVVNPFTTNNSIQCTNCTTGYNIDVSSNLCLAICGDGLVMSGLACDDNNTINGDGCSSICVLETGFFCVGAPSVCSACLTYCDSCVDATSCNTCSSITTWNATLNQCQAVCTSITYCITC